MSRRMQLKCTNCGNANADLFEIDEKNADAICTSCGIVASRLVFEESEWRDFADDDVSASRVGAASSIFGEAKLDTHIQGYNKGGDRFAVRGAIARNHAQIASDDPNEHVYAQKIATVADILQLPQETRDMAQSLYKKVRNELKNAAGKKKRLRRDGMCAALLFIAGKKTGAQRTFKAITATTNIAEKDIRNAYKSIIRHAPWLAAESTTTTVEGLITRLAAQLDLPKKITQMTITVGNTARQLSEGKLPQTVAAASIVLVTSLSGVSGMPKTKDVADAAGLAESTVTNLFRELYKMKEQLFPPNHDFSKPI